MAGSKRERELHRAKLARQQKEDAAAAERRRRILTIGGAGVGILAVIALVVGIAVAGGDDDSPTATAQSTPAASASQLPSQTPDASQPSTTKAAAVSCTAPNDKKPNNKQASKLPSDLNLQEGTYEQTLTTNCGEIKFVLDTKNAPNTSKAMLFLTDRQNFYANTTCHRLTTAGIYVIQCGDPNGNGTGGPGFGIAEENLPKVGADGSAVYKRGTIAMANAGAGTTGSQFFIVYKDSPLPPNYTVVGEVEKGMDVVDYVAAQGTADGSGDGAPKQPLQIQKMVSSLTFTPEGVS